MFDAYLQAPERLGQATAARIEADGLHRTVCDYLSGMTDRYLLEEHARLFGDGRSPVWKNLETREASVTAPNPDFSR